MNCMNSYFLILFQKFANCGHFLYLVALDRQMLRLSLRSSEVILQNGIMSPRPCHLARQWNEWNEWIGMADHAAGPSPGTGSTALPHLILDPMALDPTRWTMHEALLHSVDFCQPMHWLFEVGVAGDGASCHGYLEPCESPAVVWQMVGLFA